MLVRVEDAGGWKRKLRVGVPEAAVDKRFEELLEELAGRVEMPGFRKGKVPRDMLLQRYAPALRDDAIESLREPAIIEALKEAGFRIERVRRLQLGDADSIPTDGFYHFTVTAEVTPEIELKDYEGIEFTEHVPIVSNVDVERGLESLREQHADLAPVTRQSAAGDFVVIDYERLDAEGKPVPDSKSSDYPCEVGRGYLPPELDEALVGVAAGDEKTVSLAFPENHKAAEVAGKNVPFAVKVKEVQEKRLPPVDDAFARTAGGCETVLELRVRVRNTLEERARQFARGRLEEEIVEAVIARNPLELPESLVEERLAEMYRGATEGSSDEDRPKEDEFRRVYRPVVEHQLKAGLLLGAIAEKHGISVSEADLEGKVAELAARQRKDAAQLMKDLKGTEALSRIEDDIWLEKVHGHLVTISKVKTELVDIAKLRDATAQG